MPKSVTTKPTYIITITEATFSTRFGFFIFLRNKYGIPFLIQAYAGMYPDRTTARDQAFAEIMFRRAATGKCNDPAVFDYKLTNCF